MFCYENGRKNTFSNGFHFSFTTSDNYGVYFDSIFVMTQLLGFLEGKHNCLCLTDTNHNVKNLWYQLIGVNSVVAIGNYFIDYGMLKKLLPPYLQYTK